MKTCTSTETTLLVIGYGNTLRQDDAAGPLVAERIGALRVPGVRALARPQLTPELAAELAEARSVVFVDATAARVQAVELESIAPGDGRRLKGHTMAPPALLALARDVYGNAPAAWVLKVPAESFGHGEGFSELTQWGIEAAVRELRMLIAEWVF